MDEVDYKYAKRNPESRQEFLEGIDFENFTPFVKNIFYFEGLEGERVMETINNPESGQRLNITSTIRVSDYAFNTYSWNEFYNILVPHEGLHTLQNYFEPTSTSGKIIELHFSRGNMFVLSDQEIRQERAAHRNQAKHHTFSKCSKKFQRETRNWQGLYEKLFDTYVE